MFLPSRSSYSFLYCYNVRKKKPSDEKPPKEDIKRRMTLSNKNLSPTKRQKDAVGIQHPMKSPLKDITNTPPTIATQSDPTTSSTIAETTTNDNHPSDWAENRRRRLSIAKQYSRTNRQNWWKPNNQ